MTRHQRRAESRQMAQEAACNARDVLLGVLAWLLLTVAATVGHHIVSGGMH